jgi:hypothetical protein
LIELGLKVHNLFNEYHFRSVAPKGFEAPGDLVYYTDVIDIHTCKKFAFLGMKIAAGVPLECDEPEDYRTFRIGLFCLDKLKTLTVRSAV